ncbi:hypothetical protein SAMN06265337_0868 [Hymenobacter gelipurpurascens]|uniref:Uncharacterized protein n=1 Tax=Hymenobacter gelipurpurascens TaxID=89968 RepID=A0A212TBL9_9BACT|nr:hypothetical protein [Hymenobacter gelipurpurascens]SNC63395.1 hypothetical protein SAMN06265337_0868 [Hymenobacter gelipurpurascens]
MTKRFPTFLLVLVATTSCSRESYFQPDARVAYPAPLLAAADSALVTAGRHYQRGPLGRLLLGAHYRKVWATPVTLPVFKPATVVNGGLKFGKLGGGFQTTSATLLASSGRSYALRSIDKDPYKTLPKVLRQGFVLTTVRDATSAGMPYGAFVVPALAQAAKIPHATPRPYYIRPDEDGLGEASARLRGKVVMLEQKVEGEENIVGALKGARALEESEKMLEERYHSPEHSIDEAAFLRARLLDLWMGDWDRHEGQWNWAAYSQPNGKTLWRPIPQDRDQVFFRFDDGLVSWLVSRIVPKFRTFKPHYESIEGYTRNASFIDERALSSMPREAYSSTAQELQQLLTDEVIHAAVQKGLPREVYALEGARMEAKLRARRATLPQAAEEFYQLRARRVVVAGTDQAERFVVERLHDTVTVVSVYTLGTKKDSLLYRRRFNPADTRQVVLHGLKGKDEFTVTGSVARSPFIDIYGGPEEDTINDSSGVSGLRKKTRIYDTKRNTVFEIGPETKDHRSRGVSTHAFDRDGSGR